MIDQIIPGSHIELIPLHRSNNESEKLPTYISSYEYFQNNKLYISMPMIKTHYAPVHKGEEYEITVFCHTKIFQGRIVVECAQKEGNHYSLVTQIVVPLKKCERRQYFRLSYEGKLEYMPLTDEVAELYRTHMKEGQELGKIGYLLGSIVDISAGGMKFLSDHILSPKETLLIRFNVNDESIDHGDFIFLARVISSVKHESKANVNIHRVAFEIIDTKLQEKLISFIFKQQRKSLRHKES